MIRPASLTFLSTVAAVSLAAASCDHSGNHATRPSVPATATSVHLLIGINTSASAREQLGAYALLSAKLAGRLIPGKDLCTLLRVDYDTFAFSDRPATGSVEATLTTIAHEVQARTSRRGTHSFRFWNEVAGRVRTGKGRVVVLFFTDGWDERDTSRAAIRAAVQQLSRNKRVAAVIICGAEPPTWAGLRADFAPLGERFHILSPTEMNITVLAQHLEAARH